MSSSYSHSKADQCKEQWEILEHWQSKCEGKTGICKASAQLYMCCFCL